MDPMYKVTDRDTLQQMETNGRDQLFTVGSLTVWAVSRQVATWIAEDHQSKLA